MPKPKLFVSHVSEEAPLAGILKEHISRDFLGLLDVFVSSDLREHNSRCKLAEQHRKLTSRSIRIACPLQPRFAQSETQVLHGGSVRETAELLRKRLRSGDLAIIMGAGDIYRVTEMLIQEAQAQENLL